MSNDAAAVFQTARSLTRGQRADLAHELLLSLEDSDEADQAAVDAAPGGGSWNDALMKSSAVTWS